MANCPLEILCQFILPSTFMRGLVSPHTGWYWKSLNFSHFYFSDRKSLFYCSDFYSFCIFQEQFCLQIRKMVQILKHHICLLWLNFTNYTTTLGMWAWCITSFFSFVIIVISVLYNQRSSQLIRVSLSVVSESWHS